jgi:hypothetical protein
MEPQKTFTDLAEAASKQKEIAKGALDQVGAIDRLIQETADPVTKQKLLELRGHWVKLAGELVANTSITSSSVESTFKIISDLAKK